jgi:putative protein-disulfide isomerase
MSGASAASAADARAEPAVQISYYTDPLCCWSWAFESTWRRVRYEAGLGLRFRYRMGGLLPKWDRFEDPVQSISRPAQMAPLWRQVAEMTGAPLDPGIWIEDPPSSSYPGCLAIKAAECQGAWAAEAYLRRLREAAMLRRRNIARIEVLHQIALEAAGDLPPHLPFDPARFWEDFHGTQARDAFCQDLREARDRGISRFPALAIRQPDGRELVCVGYRPYSALQSLLRRCLPKGADEWPDRPSRVSLKEYIDYWGRLTLYELAEALNMDQRSAQHAAAQAQARDEVENSWCIPVDDRKTVLRR